MTIRDIHDLASYLGSETEHLARDVYDNTACGAWIKWDMKKVQVGSIVEGSDAEFSNTFYFPFDSDGFNMYIEELEKLTDEAWHEANDEDIFDLCLEYTDPYMEMTLDVADHILKQMEEDGHVIPTWVTPEEFINVYKECEPEEED